MVKFGFSIEAYQYEQGLKAIKLMWLAGSQALSGRSKEVLQDITEYDKHLEGGGTPIGEWDGPNLLIDEGGRLRLEFDALELGLAELNRATAISIYHHWERHVPNDAQIKGRKHPALVSDLKRSGIGVHQDIDALQFAGNFLKHGNADWLSRLFESFPDRFPQLGEIKKSNPAWWGTLQISDEHIEWFLEIAHASKRPILFEP